MNAQSPVFANAESTLINLTLDHPKFGLIPFMASPNDVEPSGIDLFARALAGEFGPIAPYTAPVIPQPVLDAQANADADKAIAAMIPQAVETLMAWAEKQANGPDKLALQTMLGKIADEKAKKK